MCDHIKFSDGTEGIICGMRHTKRFCACGRAADLLCDWKVPGRKSGTCDAGVCRNHAMQVAPNKHLCRLHQKAWDDWQRRHPSEMPTQLTLL